MIDKSKFPDVIFYDNEGAAPAMRACRHITNGHYLEVWEIAHDDPEENDDKTRWDVVEFRNDAQFAEMNVSSFETALHVAQAGHAL